jgi:hypothetical protein
VADLLIGHLVYGVGSITSMNTDALFAGNVRPATNMALI